jgi:hypothetical protein
MQETDKGYSQRKILVLKTKNLAMLESAIALGKYKQYTTLNIEGFTTEGILRKRYIVILTGTPCNLEYIVNFAHAHPKSLECWCSNPLPNQYYNHEKKEWVMKEEDKIKWMEES